jgi:hypothetical protein
MRRNQHIRRRPQRVIRRQRFRVRHVERRAADELVMKSLDERGLVDDLAAGDVGDESAARIGLVEERELVG